MEIQGYCMLKSTNTVKGYAGEVSELLKPNYLRIIDIAVDGNGMSCWYWSKSQIKYHHVFVTI